MHVLAYGEAGSGKSTFAATFPKPMLVCAFDPLGKDVPYLKKGEPQKIVEEPIGDIDGVTVRCRSVLSAKGQEIIKLVYFHDKKITAPQAYAAFLALIVVTPLEAWKTVVIDSVTNMELLARKDAQYRLNPTARDPRQWWASSTDSLEEHLMMTLSGVDTNVVVLAHIDKDKDELHGNFVHNPSAPGRLRSRLASAFGEFYRVFIGIDEEGVSTHMLQTKGSPDYNAFSGISAPNPSVPVYSALFQKGALNGGSE